VRQAVDHLDGFRYQQKVKQTAFGVLSNNTSNDFDSKINWKDRTACLPVSSSGTHELTKQ
jgi:hypothetical protein